MEKNHALQMILKLGATEDQLGDNFEVLDSKMIEELILAYGPEMSHDHMEFFTFYHYLQDGDIAAVKAMMSKYKRPCDKSSEESFLAWKQEALFQRLLYRELKKQQCMVPSKNIQKRKVRAPRGEY